MILSAQFNERDSCHIDHNQWINLPMRIQKHQIIADGKPFPPWFLQKVQLMDRTFRKQYDSLKIYRKSDAKNSFLRQIYIASLLYATDDGKPCLKFIDEYLEKKSVSKNAVRALDIDFAIASYPKEVLSIIHSFNSECLEDGKGEFLSKTMIYFQACRKTVKELQGK